MAPDIYQSFLKVTGSDMVVVASWTRDDTVVFIGVFNPKLQKIKQDDPLAFHARVNDPAFPSTFGFYADYRYGDAHNRFFAAFPQYAWLKDVNSPDWAPVRAAGKLRPNPKLLDKKAPTAVVDPCDADGPDSGS